MILLRIPPENHATIMVQISPVEPRLSSVEFKSPKCVCAKYGDFILKATLQGFA